MALILLVPGSRIQFLDRGSGAAAEAETPMNGSAMLEVPRHRSTTRRQTGFRSEPLPLFLRNDSKLALK